MNTAISTEEITDQVTEQIGFFQGMFQTVQANMLAFLIKILLAIVVLIIGTIIIKLITKAVNKALERAAAKSNFTHIKFVEDTVRFLLFAVLILIIAQFFGVSTASVVALLGSAGLAIGLAFQGALSNFAGGILLLINRPFKVNDYIILGKNETEGRVSDIGIIYTTLSIDNQRTIVIPNGSIANSTITNLSLDGIRFLELTFDISYSSDIAKAKQVLADLAKADEGVLTNRDITIFVSDLSDSSVVIGLRVYTDQNNYITTKWRLLENAKIELEKAGIQIPFNQLDVHINQ